MNPESKRGAGRERVRPSLFFLLLGLAAFNLAPAQENGGWAAPPEAKKLKNPIAVNEKTLAAGKTIYDEKCTQCHGDTGDGNTDIAATLTAKPGDLTDAHRMGGMTDGEIFWKIGEGKRPMPSFKNRLSEEQRWQVVNYIRTFSKSAAASKPAAKN